VETVFDHMNLMADNRERFDIIDGKQIALLVAPSLVFVLACVAVAARWYTRSVRRVNTITEDALCLAALVRRRYRCIPRIADIFRL
jgi:hypothetical protein